MNLLCLDREIILLLVKKLLFDSFSSFGATLELEVERALAWASRLELKVELASILRTKGFKAQRAFFL